VTVHQQQVVRPPEVLAPLIQQDLADANQAAAQAALPYHQAAGEKLLEAKASLVHGEFESWIKRNVKISQRQAPFRGGHLLALYGEYFFKNVGHLL